MTDQPQIDITKMEVSELWRLAFEQQQALTNLLGQIQQTQNNIAAIMVQIEKIKPPQAV